MMNTASADVFDPQTAAVTDLPAPSLAELPTEGSTGDLIPAPAPRPAWVEINLKQLRRNFELVNRDKPNGLGVLSIVKDEAYGHGGFQVARMALQCGASFLGLSTLDE